MTINYFEYYLRTFLRDTNSKQFSQVLLSRLISVQCPCRKPAFQCSTRLLGGADRIVPDTAVAIQMRTSAPVTASTLVLFFLVMTSVNLMAIIWILWVNILFVCFSVCFAFLDSFTYWVLKKKCLIVCAWFGLFLNSSKFDYFQHHCPIIS